jgi:hypothetical protein
MHNTIADLNACGVAYLTQTQDKIEKTEQAPSKLSFLDKPTIGFAIGINLFFGAVYVGLSYMAGYPLG